MKVIAAIRFIFFFYKGLERNFKIINYGQVPEIYITEKVTEKYFFAKGFRSIGAVVKNLMRHLLSGAVRRFDIPAAQVLFCGASRNNEREFQYFAETFSSPGVNFRYSRESNISFVEQIRSRHSLKTRFVFALIFVLSLLYVLRIKICPTSYKYLVSYARLFGWIYLSSVGRVNATNKLAVVANDHTDFPVAFSMVMQIIGVQTLYVQHAEVTEKFPALDFDYSILRNVRSHRTYEAISPVRGRVFVVPRVFELSGIGRLSKPAPVNVHVVVYLSSVFDEVQVHACVEALRGNPKVITVSVKRHPRVPVEAIRAVVDVEVLDAVPEYEHIAVVPNSSVAIELLEAGVRVYQCFALDSVTPDYYGFVRGGITRELILDDLRASFWNDGFYGTDWLPKFKIYSPAVDEEWRAVLLEAQRTIGAVLRD
ncbi:hypothetical protein [Pseudomonas sp. Gutcm_11s]|uniref:hypothetical protein n=1 Tax=Pseudomonas sp. Gutcm_11s TaxID=3026088 RepID=UPI002362D64D|nr:hypothetical protein [Pseudomonas sp. Gutcm_11s]MDD0842202.1 hypothetical protein [Pseudomonas sp. Gutcm_11s]